MVDVPGAPPSAHGAILALRDEVAKVVVGQEGTLSGLIAALLVRGHVLLEGVPGVAKTLLVKTLAALDAQFTRLQFTPDLMPSDVTGQSILDQRDTTFRFREGPVFTNLLLADEINRTPPKTQAALLEAMEERQVTVDGHARPLPDPFVVVATQNPVEYEGTYPLPEAQLDRFLFKLLVGYPSFEQETAVLARHQAGLDPHDVIAAGVRPVASLADLALARREVAAVQVEPTVLQYMVMLCRATRETPSVQLGVSPRGAAALLHASKAWAWLSGPSWVSPDEVKAVAKPVLRHRILIRPELELEGTSPDGVLDSLLATVPAPADVLPSRRLALVAVALGLALFAYPGGYVGGLWGTLAILDGALLLLAAIDALGAPSVRDLEIRRDHPPVVVQGSSATWRWHLVNDGRRRMRVAVADELAPSLGARRRRISVVLAPRARAEVETALRPERRGRFEVGELVIRVTGPLGLGIRQHRRQVPTVLRVYPPFRGRDEAELRIRRARILEVGMRSARGVGGGTEFEQLREYTPDDEVRRVDWAATARAGRPIVRTYRPERNQTVMVLLDNGRLMAAQVGGVPRVEHAMDAAIMLGHIATRLGDKAGMVTFDAAVRSIVPPVRRVDQTMLLSEAMYDLEPALSESDYQGAFTTLLSRFRRRSLIVLLSDLTEQAVGDTLLPALPLILRQHVVVVAAVRDPEVATWAAAAPADADGAYRKAAAVSALAERERTVARLRGLGVTVVDAPPGRLATQLADTYLSIKSAGRL